MSIVYSNSGVTIRQGDCRSELSEIPDGSVNCCVTSPPYWGLRDYGTDDQLGLEATPEEYVAKMVAVFDEVRRVLTEDGTLWLNLGDSYATGAGKVGECPGGGKQGERWYGKHAYQQPVGGRHTQPNRMPINGLKPKDLVGIPWRVAFALQASGWYLRQDIIWCLSGGTWLYVRSQKGDMPMMVKDLARLAPATVKLWNGTRWTQLLGMSKSERRGDEIELVLRSGERISCTPTHKFPTQRGVIEASEIADGDRLIQCQLPEPGEPRDCVLDNDAAWLAGLYIAEGSRSEDTIQFSGNASEAARWERVQRIATKFGGSATLAVDGNTQCIRVYGKLLNAIIDELTTGTDAGTKGVATVAWRYSNTFIESLMDGYLGGDGHDDSDNRRWRLGFTRNYSLERDIRTACARLGWTLTLNMSSVEYEGRQIPTFRGEIRKERSGHHNEKDRMEVVQINKARCRYVYDLGVEDEPHLFALASGVLTHNSKPNPMPESVGDRCTKAHEYIFLLSKSPKYYYDADAIAEPCTDSSLQRLNQDVDSQSGSTRVPGKTNGNMKAVGGRRKVNDGASFGKQRHSTEGTGAQSRQYERPVYETRNKRSVWTVTTKPFKGAHFAVFPPDLIEPCILAGCPEGGTVLDPFGGSGTVPQVAKYNGRNSILIELNPEYIGMIKQRVQQGALPI